MPPAPPPARRLRTRLEHAGARSFGGGAFAASLAMHAIAVGGMVWATWFSHRPGDARPALSFAIASAQEADTTPEEAPQPLPPLDWSEPTSVEVVELPVELTPADESRFDPQFREVRDPARAIARWMDTPWSPQPGGAATSAPLSGGVGELAVVSPEAPQPPPEPPAQVEPQAPAVVLARRLAGPDPQYPRAALRLREHGATLLRLHVSESGTVSDVEVVRSSGSQRLDRAAAEGVKLWRFQPARRGDTPIACSVLHQITFTLGEG